MPDIEADIPAMDTSARRETTPEIAIEVQLHERSLAAVRVQRTSERAESERVLLKGRN